MRVFDGVTGRLISQFLPYGPAIRGGAFVAVGNINGTGPEEIVVGPNVGALPSGRSRGRGPPWPGSPPSSRTGRRSSAGCAWRSATPTGPAPRRS
ncbi:MAG: hypothetical protein U0797_16590 [Gemmataceae bacterium]